MTTSRRELADSLVTDLAARGTSEGAILEVLREQGLEGLLSDREIDRRILEAAVVKKIKTKRGSSRLFRSFGIVVLVAGLLALSPGTRWSIWAVIPGGLLTLFPDDAFEEVRLPWR